MYPIQQIFFYFIIWIICWVCGFGLARFVVPLKLLHKSLIFLPTLFGAIAITILTEIFNYIGLPIKFIDKWIFIVLTLLTFISIMKHRRDFQSIPKDWLVSTICVLAGMSVMSSFIFFKSFSPYNDMFTYVSIADYLLGHGFLHPIDNEWGNQAVISQVNHYKNAGFRMGSQFLLAYFTSFFYRSFSLEMYLPLAGMGVTLYAGGIWFLSRYALNLTKTMSGIAALFTALHWSLPIGHAAHGFFPMTWGMTYFCYAISFCIYIRKGNFLWREILATGLIVSALIITYNEAMAFFLASIVLLFLLHIFLYREQWKNLAIKYGSALLLGFLFANYGTIQFIKTLVWASHSSLAFGWDIKYSVWEYWTQILSIAPWHYGFRPHMLHVNPQYLIINLSAFAAAIVCLRGFQYTEKQQHFLVVITLLFPFFTVGLYYALIAKNPFDLQLIGMTFIVFKIIKYSFYLIPPLLVILWTNAINSGRIWKFISYSVAILLFIGMLGNLIISTRDTSQQMKVFTGNQENPINEYYKLVESVKGSGLKEMNILVPTASHKHRQYVAYFLRDINFVGSWSDDGYIIGHLKDEDKNRKPDPRLPSLIYKPAYNDLSGKEMGANMILVDPGQLWIREYTDGWYNEEKDSQGNSWRWAREFGIIKLDMMQECQLLIEFDYMVMLPTDAPDELYISTDKEKKALKVFRGGWNHQSITLNVGSNAFIKFEKPTGGLKIPNDTRILGFAIRNLKIKK